MPTSEIGRYEELPTAAVQVEERHWPEEAAEIAELARRRVPRLLFVAEDADPPAATDCEEDWIRLPADPADVAARRVGLTRRIARHQSGPRLDRHGRLHAGGQWIYVESSIEQRILRLVAEPMGEVRSHAELLEAGWAGRAASMTALRVHVARLNRQLETLGLRVRSLRGEGYVMVDRAVIDRVVEPRSTNGV